MTAMDLTKPEVENHLTNLKPHVIFYDFTHWIPSITKPLGIKALHYSIISSVTLGYTLAADRYSKGRGVVYGGWVQQQLILEHPSVGCFITHCGSGSLSEALVNKCQLVLLPNVGDQILNARMMGNNLKVGVEVEKGEDGLYTKESVCKAVSIVMDDENEISKNVKANHAKIREMLLDKDLESSYIDNFCKKLQEIIKN
ncbi:hypothetical protein TSUD_92690 [Trifolium subterraneum]|uniref:Uncharacterized protein n=1 Tax=Trifolium subterraneum TaxID=3900 RepID=A0A2Z6PVE5_TRISU|nr:hypothetical protein TSUD_92690 [Trifolium subterraneum]